MRFKTIVKIGAVPAILLIGVVAMQALGSTRKQSNRRDSAPEARAVETQLLAFGDLVLRVEGNGAVESERTLDIVSEASGRVVYAKQNLKDGTFVRRGEVVVRIDSRDVENDLFAMRSEFLNAVASVLPELRIDDARIYKRWFDYFNSLDINKAIPELPEITNPQEKIKISTRNVIGLYYGVRNQEIQLSKHTVRAPFGGYISSSGLIENSFVAMGQALFTLTDPRNLVVSVPLQVDESEWLEFSTPPKVAIYADEGSEEFVTGRITRRETQVDRNSQTLNVYVTFSNDQLNPRFLPGSYVHVSIEGQTLRDVASIPRHLLDPEGYVFTMEDGKLARQQLEVLAYQGDLAIVGNSVPDETILVTTILQKPLIGMDVRSVNMPELHDDMELAEQPGQGDATVAGG